MIFTIQIISLVALVTGLSLIIASRKYKTESAPKNFWAAATNLSSWIPIWGAKKWYTAQGFKMYVTAVILAEAGAISSLVCSYLDKGHIFGIRL